MLATVDEDKPNNGFSDGKCDGLGRLWCGSGEKILKWEGSKPAMPTPHMAALHCYSAGNHDRIWSLSLCSCVILCGQ